MNDFNWARLLANSVCFFLGGGSYFKKKPPIDTYHRQLEHGNVSFGEKLQQITDEKDSIINEIGQRFQQLMARNQKCTTHSDLFKPVCNAQVSFMNVSLQVLHQNLIDALENYPLVDFSKTKNQVYVSNYRQQLEEYHAGVVKLANTFFESFDSYFQLTNDLATNLNVPKQAF